MDRYLRFTRTSSMGMIFPARDMVGMSPFDDANLSVYFQDYRKRDLVNASLTKINIALNTANGHKGVIEAISNAIFTSEQLIIDIDSTLHDDIGISTLTSQLSSTHKAGYHGHDTRIKILPSDFIADDVGRPLSIDDTTSDRWLESYGTAKMYASILIPTGFKATECAIYGSATSAITVYEADINSKTITSRATGNIQTPITGGSFTNVTADDTNSLLIEMAQASGEEVYGGYITIESVSS